jgi:hypothetical protein
MLAANRMTPPRSGRRDSHPAAAHSGGMVRPDAPTTYRAPGRFRSGGEHKTNFQTGPDAPNASHPAEIGVACSFPEYAITIVASRPTATGAVAASRCGIPGQALPWRSMPRRPGCVPGPSRSRGGYSIFAVPMATAARRAEAAASH